MGGALQVLQAARQARPRRVVIGGSGAVYGCASAYVLHEGKVVSLITYSTRAEALEAAGIQE